MLYSSMQMCSSTGRHAAQIDLLENRFQGKPDFKLGKQPVNSCCNVSPRLLC